MLPFDSPKNIRKFNISHPLIRTDHIPSYFLKAAFHKFYSVHSWPLGLIWYFLILTSDSYKYSHNNNTEDNTDSIVKVLKQTAISFASSCILEYNTFKSSNKIKFLGQQFEVSRGNTFTSKSLPT